MPKKQRSLPFRHAEFILQNYWNYKREIEERTCDYTLASPVNDNTPVQSGRTSDPTANAGMRLAADNYVFCLRSALKAVEETLFEFADHDNGAAVIMLVKLIYWENQSLGNAASNVNYSYIHAQRLREDFVNELVRRLGWSE
jgi:hypothetical protein